MVQSTSTSEFAAELSRYHRKCRQHLERTIVTHDVMLRHVADIRATALEKKSELFDDNQGIEQKIAKSIEESHFLLLKVNFEFFVSRTLSLFWESFAEEVFRAAYAESGVEHIKNLNVSKRAWVSAAVAGDWESVRNDRGVIPSHGLTKLSVCCGALCGTGLHTISRSPENREQTDGVIDPWFELQCSFGIRHLLEHQKGRVDEKFLADHQKMLPRSTWRNRVENWNSQFRNGDRPRISVTSEDLSSTFKVMCATSDGLYRKLKQASEGLGTLRQPTGQ